MNKIALYLPSLRGGGAERVMSILAAEFAARGYQVDLVLADAIGPYLQNLPASVNVIDLKSKRVIYSLPKLIKYLKQNKPDALLSTQSHANVIALWAAQLSGFQGRVVIRQANMMALGNKRKHSIRSRLAQWLLKSSCNRADAIVVLNQSMADEFHDLMKCDKDKLHLINNPVAVQDIEQQAREPNDHPWLNRADLPVIISVGRLNPQKNFPFIIKAFAKFQEKYKSRLIILGEGSLRSEIEKLIHDLELAGSVDLPGFQNNPYSYMARASVFVLPSRWEGFPNVLVEAMALGLPVISSDCPGGSAEILEHGKWGRLVPVDDIDALVDALENTLMQHALLDTKERVKAFSENKITSKYLELLIPYK